MLRKNFRGLFLENALTLLWSQWSALGVLGQAGNQDRRVIDPEALLFFTLKMGRYEPRLFDEVMDWLAINGQWVDLQRVRGMLRSRDLPTRNLMGAAAMFMAKGNNQRKWKNLAEFCLARMGEEKSSPSPLFFTKNGAPHPASGKPDPWFLSFGFNRPRLVARRLTREAPVNDPPSLRFRLRALFGVGSRAECLAYLLTHNGGHPAEIAKAIGLSVRGTQDALIDLSRSGLVLTRVRGKRKIEYWLSRERWWKFLSGGGPGRIGEPEWVDWTALFSAFSRIWNALDEAGKKPASAYLASSLLRDSFEEAEKDFSKCGLDLPPLPGKNVKPQEFEKAFQIFIAKVFELVI
jgi:hypothetical protein